MEIMKQQPVEPSKKDYRAGWAHFNAVSDIRRIKQEMALHHRDLQQLEQQLHAAIDEERRLYKLIEQFASEDVMPEPGERDEDDREAGCNDDE